MFYYMFTEIKQHLEQALMEYTTGERYEILLKAKEEYFALTGVIHEESDEFEHKMNCFNDWFLLHYTLPNNGPDSDSSTEEEVEKNSRVSSGDYNNLTIIKSYLLSKGIENDEIIKAFSNVNYSLFEFKKTNGKKQAVLKDILHDSNIVLSEMQIGIIEKDIFVGRTINVNGENYLLRGICVLPAETKSVCSKQSKLIRKLNNRSEEFSFLLNLEFLKTKWTRYSRHIEANKIFVF